MARVIQENGVWILRSDWHIEDIKNQSENMGLYLSDDECLQIMDIIADSFDANLGINWEIIDYAINEYMRCNDE
jgi:hypothetical protein